VGGRSASAVQLLVLLDHVGCKGDGTRVTLTDPLPAFSLPPHQLCLVHSVNPPSWNAARRLLSRPNFVEQTLDLHPAHIPASTKDTVRELFRLTHVASVYRKQAKVRVAVGGMCLGE